MENNFGTDFKSLINKLEDLIKDKEIDQVQRDAILQYGCPTSVFVYRVPFWSEVLFYGPRIHAKRALKIRQLCAK